MSNLFTPSPVIFADTADTPVNHTYNYKFQDVADKTANVVGVWQSEAASGDNPVATTLIKHNFKAKDLRRSLMSDKFEAPATKSGVSTVLPGTFNFTSTLDKDHDLDATRARFGLFLAKLSDPKFFDAFFQGYIE